MNEKGNDVHSGGHSAPHRQVHALRALSNDGLGLSDQITAGLAARVASLQLAPELTKQVAAAVAPASKVLAEQMAATAAAWKADERLTARLSAALASQAVTDGLTEQMAAALAPSSTAFAEQMAAAVAPASKVLAEQMAATAAAWKADERLTARLSAALASQPVTDGLTEQMAAMAAALAPSSTAFAEQMAAALGVSRAMEAQELRLLVTAVSTELRGAANLEEHSATGVSAVGDVETDAVDQGILRAFTFVYVLTFLVMVSVTFPDASETALKVKELVEIAAIVALAAYPRR